MRFCNAFVWMFTLLEAFAQGPGVKEKQNTSFNQSEKIDLISRNTIMLMVDGNSYRIHNNPYTFVDSFGSFISVNNKNGIKDKIQAPKGLSGYFISVNPVRFLAFNHPLETNEPKTQGKSLAPLETCFRVLKLNQNSQWEVLHRVPRVMEGAWSISALSDSTFVAMASGGSPYILEGRRAYFCIWDASDKNSPFRLLFLGDQDRKTIPADRFDPKRLRCNEIEYPSSIPVELSWFRGFDNDRWCMRETPKGLVIVSRTTGAVFLLDQNGNIKRTLHIYKPSEIKNLGDIAAHPAVILDWQVAPTGDLWVAARTLDALQAAPALFPKEWPGGGYEAYWRKRESQDGPGKPFQTDRAFPEIQWWEVSLHGEGAVTPLPPPRGLDQKISSKGTAFRFEFSNSGQAIPFRGVLDPPEQKTVPKSTNTPPGVSK